MDAFTYPTEVLINTLVEVQRARAVSIICLTCVLWHQLSTMADEVRLVWRYGPLRVNSCLFLCIRYLTLLSFTIRTWSLFQASPSSSFCQISVLSTSIVSLIIISLCDFVLLIRVWAIYRRRRLVLSLLLAAFVVTTTLMVLFGIRWLSELKVSTMSSVSPLLSGCVNVSPSLGHHWQIYPFTIAFNSILLAMTAYKSIHISWNHNSLTNAPWYAYTRTTMTSLLLRDGALSYLVVLLALLFTAFGCFIQGWRLVALQSGIAPAVLSIAASQLQLNLRGALAKPPTRFCSCPPSHPFMAASRPTLIPISIPTLRFGSGVVHHELCALSSTSTLDDHIFSSLTSTYDDDNGECVFNHYDETVSNDYDSEEYKEQELEDKLARSSFGSADCESLRLPCPPLAVHVSRTSRTVPIPPISTLRPSHHND